MSGRSLEMILCLCAGASCILAQTASAQEMPTTSPTVAPGSTSLFQDAKSLLNKFADLPHNGGTTARNVSIRAPFVKVDVKDGERHVRVKAPFVNVDKVSGSRVSVKAPFVKVQKQTDGVAVKAPLVNVQKSAAKETERPN